MTLATGARLGPYEILASIGAGGVVLRQRLAPPASRPAAASLEDLQIVQLTTSGNAQRPAISPDGKYVAYVQQDGNDYSLWIRQTATASNVQIVRPVANIQLLGVAVTRAMAGNSPSPASRSPTISSSSRD